ncbi:MAG: hypothetical protein J5929_06405 [Eubacterium sp.]|nr:hypothetical protein [Eubacterium sp.]
MAKKRRTVISVLLTIVCISALFGFKTSVFANDFPGTVIVKSGETVSRSFEMEDYKQLVYFRFDVIKLGMVNINITFEDIISGNVTIYDSNKDEIFIDGIDCKEIWGSDDTGYAQYSFSKLFSAGTYYIEYENTGHINPNYYSDGIINVTYKLTNMGISSNIDTDYNDSITFASDWNYKEVSSFTGAFSYYPTDISDYYRINIASDSNARLKVVSDRSCIVKVYDNVGNELEIGRTDWNAGLQKYIFDKNFIITEGIRYIGLLSGGSYEDNSGCYTIKLVTTAIKEDSQSDDSNDAQNNTRIVQWKSNETGWWIEDDSGWYPVNEWQRVDGIWYFFKPDGYMASNEYYGGYWFNSDGSWGEPYYLTWKQNTIGWWVEDISGWWPSSSWLKIDGCWYYFNSSGYMVTSQYIDGWWIDADGVCR